MSMSDQKENSESTSQEESESVNPRRDALKKMGKYAAYTAPAMVAMLASKKGAAGTMSSPPE